MSSMGNRETSYILDDRIECCSPHCHRNMAFSFFYEGLFFAHFLVKKNGFPTS